MWNTKIDLEDTIDTIRRICARLIDAPPDSAEAVWYRDALKKAAAALAAEQREWSKASEPDRPQDGARQSYRNRESDSADAFADGLNLFNPKKRDSEKKKSD